MAEILVYRNPFLDTLFDWGFDKYWGTFEEFIQTLDSSTSGTLSNWVDEFQADFEGYDGLDWYFMKGKAMNIDAFDWSEGRFENAAWMMLLGETLSVPIQTVRDYSSYSDPGISSLRRYQNLPEALTPKIWPLETAYPELPQLHGTSDHGHVQLLLGTDGLWYNALYFTLYEGVGWPSKPIGQALNYPQGGIK